jgi:hypothetical protein
MVCGEIIVRKKIKSNNNTYCLSNKKNNLYCCSKALRMKKFIYTCVLPSCLFFSNCNNKPHNDAITLKFNPPNGSSYNYSVNMDMSMSGNANGMPINMKNKMAMGYDFATVGDSSGWKKLTATISHIAMHLNSNGVNIDFDSDSKPDSSDMVSGAMGKMLGALKGGQFGFTMNEQGKIGSVTGINDMMQRILTSVDVSGSASIVAGMNNVFNEENFKQNIQQSFGMYPDKPVKPGDTWMNTMDMTNQNMPMKIESNYTLESANGNTANVKVDSKISSPNGASTGITGTMNGNMKFDIPTGLPTDGDLDMNMNMTMNTGGQLVPMNTNIKMKITGKKS